MEDRIVLEGYSIDEVMKLCGPDHMYLNYICDCFHCIITHRDNDLKVVCESKEQFEQVQKVIQSLSEMMQASVAFDERDVIYICKLIKQKKTFDFATQYQKPIGRSISGKLIYPKTIGQRQLFKAMCTNDIVFASGVAGTGKTYLAVVYAVNQLKQGAIRKIILTRPAVEAGESLGFLPGDLKEKVDPYLRPLYDALYDMLGKEQVEKLIEKEIIEIAPLAYMRGRTLDQAFIILDEAQNTTKSQMKMFLTRMGFQSKIVITGDVSQIDLIRKQESGLLNAKKILSNIPQIAFVELTSLDVVRHPLVQKIIERYEQEEELHG